MNAPPRVSIAGAGVFGLATALCLAEAGCAVEIWDEGAPSASAMAAGMLAPVFEAALDPVARPHADLLLAARDLWPGAAARWGVALDRTGAVAVGEPAWLAEVSASLPAPPVAVGADWLNTHAPGLRARHHCGLLVAGDWRLDPPAALEMLWRAAREAGVSVCHGRLDARPAGAILVVATGAAQELTPELVRLSPIKGHLARVGGPARGPVVRADGVYAAPGFGGVTFGATMEAGVADTMIDPACAAPLLRRGLALFPGLVDAPQTLAVGVRAATPDGLPMVGASVLSDTFLAVGARRNGWLLAPLVGRMVSAYVMGRDPGPYAARLNPARFGAR